jgi:CPA2 family monovalent cation:H+ antiporter-2
MALTPLVSGLTPRLYAFRQRRFKREPLQTINLPQTGLCQHVVIAGGGRVGEYVAQVLQRLELAFVIIELDYQRVVQIKNAGMPVIFGDAGQPVVLEAAEVAHARLLLLTTPDIITTQTIVDQVRQLHPALHIVSRAEGIEQLKILHDHGVYEVVQPEFEAALEITRQALLHLNIPATEIRKFADAIRRELYAPMYQRHHEYPLTQLENTAHLLDLIWVTVAKDSPMIGQTIKALKIRERTGISIVGVMHAGILQTNPHADYCFVGGDLVAVMGNAEQFTAFQKLANPNSLGGSM